MEDFIGYGKIPPQAIDFEEVVLGAIMLESDAFKIADELLTPLSFYKESHIKIFAAAKHLSETHENIDILTITNRLRNTGELKAVGGAYYITQLTSRVASSANIEFHCAIINQKHLQRELIRISSETLQNAYNSDADVFEMFEHLETDLQNIQKNATAGNNKAINEHTEEARTQLNKRVDSLRKGKTLGIPTGLCDLDKMLGGLQPETIVVAARPSMGKTAFILKLAKECAKSGKAVKMYELEMSGVRLADRVLLSETEIDIDNYRVGNITDQEMMEFEAAKSRIDRLPIYVDDRSGVNINYICRDAKATKRKIPNLGMLIIDHCGLLEIDDKNRNNEIGKITRKAHQLRKDLDIPVLLIFQLNRQVENRNVKDKRPILADLRDSGNIEQDVDTVLFLYRPAYYGIEYDPETNESYVNYGEIIIAKRRDGQLGIVPFKHNKGLTKFFDHDFKRYEEPMQQAYSTKVPFPESKVFTAEAPIKTDDVPF